MGKNSGADGIFIGDEYLAEVKKFKLSLSKDFSQKHFTIRFIPRHNYKVGSVFSREDVLLGINSIAVKTGNYWPEGTIFTYKDKDYIVIYNPGKIFTSGALFDMETGLVSLFKLNSESKWTKGYNYKKRRYIK